jgi:hypothetical protein
MSAELSTAGIIFATVMGPILAVRAQSYLEDRKKSRERKFRVFEALMATRSTRISPEHVKALNMIDIAFAKETVVLGKWKEYWDHLSTPYTDQAAWAKAGDSYYADLLYEMSLNLGYSFDRVILRKGGYYPQAHVDFEQEQVDLRRASKSVLSKAEEVFAVQKQTSKLLAEALEGQRTITVRIEDSKTTESKKAAPFRTEE